MQPLQGGKGLNLVSRRYMWHFSHDKIQIMSIDGCNLYYLPGVWPDKICQAKQRKLSKTTI